MFSKILNANRGELALRVIQFCKRLGIQSEAIHPGYGFYLEKTYFAEISGKQNITFIDPSHKTISRMSVKSVARATMRRT